ncbi:MAG: hypothetical protein Q9183_006925 [Haloplaca sp. 2 TL-2023]
MAPGDTTQNPNPEEEERMKALRKKARRESFERHLVMLSTLGAKNNGYLVYHYDMEDLFNLLKKRQGTLRDYKAALPTNKQQPSYDPIGLFEYEVGELRQHIAMCRTVLLLLDMKVDHGP